MSDVKEVGVIGQMYEDRTTGKVGTLESRDDKCKTLMMIGADGKGFSISYSSFRSKWRKYTDKNVATEEEKKEEVPVPTAVVSNYVEVKSDDNEYHFVVQELEVITVKIGKDDTYHVSCLPDIYTDAVELRPYTSDFKCAFTKSGRDVSFTVVGMSKDELLKLLTAAATEINLYGYIEE